MDVTHVTDSIGLSRANWNKTTVTEIDRTYNNNTDVQAAVTGADGATTSHSVSSGLHSLSWDDATWILTSSFIIFTIQTGFGLLEAGSVRQINEVNIMVKNAIDVIFGGITYWAFGFGFSFGNDPGSNAFTGLGYWFVETDNSYTMGQVYSTFIFQLSFATTATTIVSGAMAERTNLRAYICFSLLNTLVYCFPAHWVWADNGFLHTLGCIDIAGSGSVHLLGAGSALVAAWMLGPRMGRYDHGREPPPIGNGTNTLIGMFMLWWGWLAFNSGSTFGISGGKWILAAKSAATTLVASMGGGVTGIILTGWRNNGKIMVPDLANSVLGSLVSITACCPLVHLWEACIIGSIGGILCALAPIAMDYAKIDDPVCAFAVHGVGGIWGLLAVGLFTDIDHIEHLGGEGRGLFHGGGVRLLGVQLLSLVTILSWSLFTSFIMLYIIDKIFGLRLSAEHEELGSDFVEHGIGHQHKPETRTTELDQVSTEQNGTDGKNLFRTKNMTSFFGFRRESNNLKELNTQEEVVRNGSMKRTQIEEHIQDSNGTANTFEGMLQNTQQEVERIQS